MFEIKDVLETTRMITENNLDVRTITMGISLRDCAHPDIKVTAQKIYDKVTKKAENLVKVGQELETELGVPIINKRVSVTPVAIVGESCDAASYVPLAKALDDAGRTIGVDFVGGFSALVDKGYTNGDRKLIASIPEALAETQIVCSSVSVGSTKCGINMDAVAEMGRVVKEAAALTADRDAIGCAKLVIFCNAVQDNPFMAGAFHGVTEPESVINVGVSGPGVVKHALESVRGADVGTVAETIKKTAFKITEEQAKHILGTQANLWTEYIPTSEQVEYMVLPRMAALAEVQWTQLEKKDYTNFTTRLAGLIGLYRRDGLNYREPFRQQADSTATEKK